MKTLADIKRRIKVGQKMDLKHLQDVWNPGIREVSLVQSNTFALKTQDRKDPTKFNNSYCEFPKAKEVKITGPNTFEIHGPWNDQESVPILEYTFID